MPTKKSSTPTSLAGQKASETKTSRRGSKKSSAGEASAVGALSGGKTASRRGERKDATAEGAGALGKGKALKVPSVQVPETESKLEDIVIPEHEIALRAYFISERRQRMGWPGDPHSDWIEAENQLKAEALRSLKQGRK